MSALIFRILAIGLILWLSWKAYKALAKIGNSSSGQGQPQQSAEVIYPCAFCGTHISEKRALTHNGKFFCSQEHLEQHLNQ